MAYRALYRAYRPQHFDDVAGQKHVTQTLKNAIKENKIAHAYLFCGPRGTGKTSIAKIFAKAINCEHPEKDVPCNQCDNCIAITNGEHPDILEIDAASNNGVDEVRDLIEKVKYAPIKGRYKVYIIDEVHMMSPGAFNALLKTLEEPPAHVVFILATTEPQKVLPTIISRCQRFDFTKLSVHDIVEYLEMVLHKENVTYEKEALQLIAELAEGGMRDSLSILEQCLAYSGQSLTLEDVNLVYGIISTKDKIELILQLMHQDMADVLQKLNKMNENGTDIKRLTFDLIQILKDVIIYKNTKQENLLFVLNEDHVKQITPYITAEECFNYIDILTNAIQKYRETSDAKIYFELACMRICNHVYENVTEVVKSPIKPTIPQKEEPLPPEEPLIHDYQEESNSGIHEMIEEETIIRNEEKVAEMTKVVEPQSSPATTTPTITPMPTTSSTVTKEQQKQTVTDGDIAVEFSEILNILVQADRKILVSCQEKWVQIKRYMANLNTAKWAAMVMDSAPVAAGVGGLILACEHQAVANNLNYYKNYFGVKNFLKDILGAEFDYIAVTRQQWTDIRNSYLKIRAARQLPKPQPIHISHIENNQEPEKDKALTEGQRFAVELFGDIVEIVEEQK